MEGFFEMVHDGLHPLFRGAFFILDGVRPVIQGEEQEIHRQAQDDDGQAVIIQDIGGKAVDILIQDFDGPDQQLIKKRRNRHNNTETSVPVSPGRIIH